LTYSIRLMEKEDLAQVNEIDREAFYTQWPPPNYRRELQNKLAHYIVAYDDARTVEATEVQPQSGLSRLLSRMRLWFNRNHTPDKNASQVQRQYIVGFSGIWVLADEAHITNIAVRQQYQRQGIGELLLISTIDLAKELKANTMTLEVRASNLAAQNLYSKYGFMQVGLRRGYYLDNREDAILMSTDSINSESFRARLEQLREALARRFVSQPTTGKTSATIKSDNS
jgi:ribosomal-protein-alanine N-acetyltransferase